MNRRILTVVAVATVLVLAGCSGGSSGTASPPTNATTTAPTTTQPTTTQPTPSTSSATPSPTEEPPSAIADEVRKHRDGLRAAGSYTSRIRVNQSVGSTTQNVTLRYLIDYDADRYLSNATLRRPGVTLHQTRYTAGETTYQRVSTGGTPRYSNASAPYEGSLQPVNRTRASGGPTLVRDLSRIDLERDGTGTFRGTELKRFTASGAEAWDVERPGQLRTIESFRMTVLVDDDGVIRKWNYTLTGTTASGSSFRFSFRMTVTDLGNTTVSEPGWTAQAR